MTPSLFCSVTALLVSFQCGFAFADGKAGAEAAALFKRAEGLLADKKYDAAMTAVSRGVALEPRNPKGYVIRGKIRSNRTTFNIKFAPGDDHDNGDQRHGTENSTLTRLALDDFNRALNLGARGTQVQIEIGSCYLRLYDLDKAEASFSKAIQSDADSADALQHRALCYLMKSQYASAVQDLNRVLKLQPRNTEALNRRAYCRALLQSPDEAYTDYSNSIQFDRRNSGTWLARGALQMLRSRAEGNHKLLQPAIRDIKKAIELNPKDASAYSTLAAAYDQNRMYADAIEALTTGIRNCAKKARLYRARGITYYRMGRQKAAIVDADMSVKLATTVKEKASFYKERGDLFLLLGDKQRARRDAARGRWYAALAKLNIQLTRNPDDRSSRLARGKHFQSGGDWKKAIADFTAVLKSNPKSNVAFVGRARSFLAAGESSRALTDCNAALKLNPKDREAISTRADALLAKGDYSKAIADYQRINAFGGNFARAYWLRADAHKKAGRLSQAEADYRKAAAMDPSLKRR